MYKCVLGLSNPVHSPHSLSFNRGIQERLCQYDMLCLCRQHAQRRWAVWATCLRTCDAVWHNRPLLRCSWQAQHCKEGAFTLQAKVVFALLGQQQHSLYADLLCITAGCPYQVVAVTALPGQWQRALCLLFADAMCPAP